MATLQRRGFWRAFPPYVPSWLINGWLIVELARTSPSIAATMTRVLFVGASLAFIWIGGRGLASRLQRGSAASRVATGILIGVVHAACLIGAIVSVDQLGSLPNDGMLNFTLHSPAGARRLLVDAVTGRALWPAAVFTAVMVACWVVALHRPPATTRNGRGRSTWLLALAMVMAVAGLPSAAELTVPVWFGRLAYFHAVGRAPASSDADVFVANRVQLPPAPPADPAAPRPNVVLFRLEEITADRFGLAHPERGTTPSLAALASDPAGTLVYFPHHFTNAGATDVSVPSIMLGLSPSRSGRDFGHFPLVWQYARALGYDTSYISAFDMSWGRLDRTMSLVPGAASVGHLIDGRTYHAPILYDSCVSDALVSHAAIQTIDAADRRGGAPFLIVVDYCLSHGQGQGVPEVTPKLQCDGRDDYDCSIAETDRQMGSILQTLRDRHLLDRTLVMGVSDHGTGLARGPRVLNYYQEVAHVPFFVFVPKTLAPTLDERDPNWRRAGDAATANVDATPTIVDLIGGERDPDIAALLPSLDGRDVFSAGAARRDWIEMLNTDALRQWRPEGYALIYRGRYKMIFFDGMRQMFDLQRDPGERADLLDGGHVDPALLALFRAHVLATPRLLAIEAGK